MQPNRFYIIILLFLLILISGFIVLNSQPLETTKQQLNELSVSQKGEPSPQQKFTVMDKQLLFTGGYADASVIQMSDGKYRMYLSGPLKNSGRKGTFVLSSDDGLFWKEETDIIFPGVAVARAFLFSDGVRYYYHQPPREKENRGTIVSSFSEDGITGWINEGVRIRPMEGYAVAGPSLVRLKDRSYRMFFFEGEIEESDGKREIKNSRIYGASSPDGLKWARDEEPAVAYEENVEGAGLSHNQSSQVLHPFVTEWPERGGYLMLYNSHSRIFAAFSNNSFNWEKLGYIGVIGADADAIYIPDGTFRIYFGGGCTDVSRNYPYADDVKDRLECVDPETGKIITIPGTIHTAILNISLQ